MDGGLRYLILWENRESNLSLFSNKLQFKKDLTHHEELSFSLIYYSLNDDVRIFLIIPAEAWFFILNSRVVVSTFR